MRLFVAVPLPDRLREQIAALQADLPPSLRRTDPGDAHVTLKFLGAAEPTPAARSVRAAVASADVAPFEATLSGLGVFPALDYVRVVWLGVQDGTEELARLADAVERETVAAGFDPRDHEFTPHVTLARMDDARGKERVRELVEETDPEPGSFRVESVRLMESTGGEPRYRTVERVPLDR
ncbi:MAG: RNA 2',3'-cyclic phosphodiesterase [Haloferacaceae archaeon]